MQLTQIIALIKLPASHPAESYSFTRIKTKAMNNQNMKAIFSDTILRQLFPPQRTADFFEALFGDDSEGAYDVKLRFGGYNERAKTLEFFLDLHERPGSCLVCSLTYGLPEVFSRHPVINIRGLVKEIEQQLDGSFICSGWKLGTTRQIDKSLHSIPFTISLTPA